MVAESGERPLIGRHGEPVVEWIHDQPIMDRPAPQPDLNPLWVARGVDPAEPASAERQ